MDNCKLHHSPEVEKLIEESGNHLIFNTPYSSPLNPIEYVFGLWKTRSETTCYEHREEILQRITDTFYTITPRMF